MGTISNLLRPNAPAVHLESLPGSIDFAGIGEGFVFHPEIASTISQLWQDPIVTTVIDHSSDFYLMDLAQ